MGPNHNQRASRSVDVGHEILPGTSQQLVLFLLSAIVVFATMNLLYSAIETLRWLEVVESEHDQWQRPSTCFVHLIWDPVM